MTVVTFLLATINFVTIILSCLLLKKKKKKTRFEISICVIMLWDIMWEGWDVVVQKVVTHIQRH
jgi:hypothetical protein